jgi:hypothetical protein
VLSSRSSVSAVLACCLAASACADRDPPTVTPSALLHRNDVALGAPVDITLRFRLAHGAAPLAGNHRVLLRFLFDDGTVMASYDHDPPTPAQEWQPETPVTYTRRIFAPEIPYVGDVPVVVGLVPSSGKRLRLFGKEVGDRMYEVARFKLHAQRILVVPLDGWHRHEGDGEGGYRWTQSRSTLTFRNPRQDSVLHLRLSAQPDVFPAPQQASLHIGSGAVHTFPVAATQTDYQIPLTAADFGADDEVLMTIAVDRTFVPAEVQKGGDHRELGVRVHNIFLETSGLSSLR